MKNFVIAIRPKTLLASLGPVFLGIFLALDHHRKIDLQVALATGLCALFMQMGTNLVNDYFDNKRGVDTANRLGPPRAAQAKLLSSTQIKMAYNLCFILSLVIGSYLMYEGGWPIIIIGLTSLITAYCYTGGPIPLSHFYLGELLAFIFFGPVAVWGTYFLQTQTHSSWAIFLGLGIGAISSTIMGINNLRDEATDRLSHKKTLAILLGKEKMKIFLMSMLILSGVVPIIYAFYNSKLLTLLPLFLIFIFRGNWKRIYFGQVDSGLNKCLAYTGIYLVLYGIILGVTLNL